MVFNEGTIGAADRNNIIIPDLYGLPRHDPGCRNGLRDRPLARGDLAEAGGVTLRVKG